jgi:thiol:disulfide interchange protein DsbA
LVYNNALHGFPVIARRFMKRREFTIALGVAPLIARPAWAAAEAIEGRQYTRVSPPVPVAVPGKIEVIEFFGYWCPHCNEFEPRLEAWVKKLPGDVNFRRIPVAWQKAHLPYQRLFFALEALGVGPEVHRKVFDAVHVQHLHVESDAGLAAFAGANGIDAAKLADAMKSFTVASRTGKADQLWAAYRLEVVPTLTVNGRFITSPEMTGGEDQALRVADELIRKARTPGA